MSCSVRVVRACASVTLSECVYTFSKVKRAASQKHDTRMGENRHQSEQPRSIKGEIDTHQLCMDTRHTYTVRSTRTRVFFEEKFPYGCNSPFLVLETRIIMHYSTPIEFVLTRTVATCYSSWPA